MRYLMITTIALGCCSFNAECGGILSGNPLKRAERFIRKEAIPTVKKEVDRVMDQAEDKAQKFGNFAEKAGNKIGKEATRVFDQAKDYVKEEVAPTIEQVGRDIGKGVENTGKAIGKGVVSAHNEADRFVEDKAIPFVEKGIDTVSRESNRVFKQAEDKAQRTKNEINSFIKKSKKALSDDAVKHLQDRSPTVSIITKVDDFIKQHPVFTYSVVMVAIAGMFRAGVENFRDLFQFLNKFAQKDL